MTDLSTGLFGELPVETLLHIFDTLPVDVTFVDAEDTVVYFNQPREGRAFPRTKSEIGRKVQRCHPLKSVHVVNQIIEEFRLGKRKTADFWINHNSRVLYIRYFPVHDDGGNYHGVLEVTQDITDIKEIKGEKRLLDEPPSDT